MSLRRFACTLMLMGLFAVSQASAWLKTGQSASILLSGIGFNDAGYLATPGDGLFFNHPGNLATDGSRLILADKNNNRVLLWNTLPSGNQAPDVVLGQPAPHTILPGTDLGAMNWPVGVAVAGGRVVVADTNNDRLLIWSSVPVRHGQPADFAMTESIRWPWAVWTDGTKLIAASTGSSKVYIWLTFPTGPSSKPDLTLTGRSSLGAVGFGTPRSIGTDGSSYLVIGDHNSRVTGSTGSFVWNTFPSTNDQPYDVAFRPSNVDANQVPWGGAVTSDGRFVMMGGAFYVWNSRPTTSRDADVVISGLKAGDGASVATAGNRVFVSLANDNRIVGWDVAPASSSSGPDFVIGGPDLTTNTLTTHAIVTNPVPATDGTSLFVTSDFDRKLYVWSTIPSADGTLPDITCPLSLPPWDNTYHAGRFVAGGRGGLLVWKGKPIGADACTPTTVLLPGVFEITGVALDDRYLYVADGSSRILVWNATDLDTLVASHSTAPLFTVSYEKPVRLSSDGQYLVVSSWHRNRVALFSIDGLSASSTPLREIDGLTLGTYGVNLPQDALAADGHLFIADTNHSRVLGWEKIDDALSGKTPDVMLGKADATNFRAEIGKSTMFWPGALAYYGKRLWVGEFKFSSRLVGFDEPGNSSRRRGVRVTPSPPVVSTVMDR